jgi:type IV pilus assembly protein PilM
MADRVVGVDIGSTSVRAVEVENPAGSKATVLRYHEVPMAAGAAVGGEVVEPHSVAAALKELWSSGGFTSKNIVLGIGNQRVLARDLTMPRGSMTQIVEALPFQVQDMLPIPVADALLSFYPISEGQSDAGPTVNGLLVAAVKQVVLTNISTAKLAGLSTVEVDLIPFALVRALTRAVTSEGTIAIVDVGAATTTVVIVIAGVPQFVRIIPSAGSDATKSLTGRIGMTDIDAEQAKRALGLPSAAANPDHRAMYEAIYESSFELLNSVRNTISYFDNTHDIPNVESIVITGGGSRLGGFTEALSELTRTPVVVAAAFAGIAVKNGAAAAENLDGDAMIVALGLALGSAA